MHRSVAGRRLTDGRNGVLVQEIESTVVTDGVKAAEAARTSKYPAHPNIRALSNTIFARDPTVQEGVI